MVLGHGPVAGMVCLGEHLSLAALPLLARPGAVTEVTTVEGIQAALTGWAQQDLRQIETDVAQVQRQGVQRAAWALEVLRTRNDILNTLYDKHRNWMIALVGVGLALGQVLDRDVARWVAAWGLDRLWLWLGWDSLGLKPPSDELPLLLIRVGSILGLTALLGAGMACGLRLLHWWQARRR